MNLEDRIASGAFTLIAEIGVNYYDIARQRGISPMEAAKLMCKEASEAGVHAVKFQTYKAESLASRHSPSYWDTSEESSTSQYELFKRYDSFGEREYRELSVYCDSIGIGFCSTPFDFESADYLEPLMGVYKVSSSDLTNIPFIEHQARKGKPMILSVGAGDLTEMRSAVQAVRAVNDSPLALLHCVLEYPTPYEHANLSRIASITREFPDVIVRCCSMAAIIAPSYFQTPCSGGFFIFRVWKPRDPVAPIPTQCRPIPWANRGNAIDRVVFFSPYGPFMEKSAFVCRKSRNPCVETPPQWA